LDSIGSIHLDHTRNRVIYSIDSNKDFKKLIIHIEKYPLLTQKAADFLLFKQVVELMSNKAHFTIEGLNQIVFLPPPTATPPSKRGGRGGGEKTSHVFWKRSFQKSAPKYKSVNEFRFI